MKFLSFLLLSSMFFLQGCFSTANYYVLSVAPIPKDVYKIDDRIIGVEKITLPSYLYKRELLMANSAQEIVVLSDALWAEDLDIGLTQRMIAFLQNKFNEPNVYAYPWGVMKQVDIKITVNISRFIVEKDKVYLEATWSLEALAKKEHRVSQLFRTSIASKNDSTSIVKSMDKAFSSLEEAIALGIKKF